MWILTVLFITSLGSLNQSVAEDIIFSTKKGCSAYYQVNKETIDKDIHRSINTYLRNRGISYKIEWIGCMHWDDINKKGTPS